MFELLPDEPVLPPPEPPPPVAGLAGASVAVEDFPPGFTAAPLPVVWFLKFEEDAVAFALVIPPALVEVVDERALLMSPPIFVPIALLTFSTPFFTGSLSPF